MELTYGLDQTQSISIGNCSLLTTEFQRKYTECGKTGAEYLTSEQFLPPNKI